MSGNQWIDGLIGQTFKGFRITGYIARGGMGVVFKGVQESLDRPVAIKVLYPHLIDDESFRERFAREAQAASRLIHPNIVRTLDYGTEELNFMVLDLVDGVSLSEHISRLQKQDAKFPQDQSIQMIREIGSALQYAHDLGYVHRDIKPANVLLDQDGKTHLTDFGVVKVMDSAGMTATGTIIGTPEYMSPEQSLGTSDVGPASDQYSLAVVAYELLVGRVPFQSPTPAVTLRMIVSDPLPAPSDFDPSFPKPIENVLLKGLSKDPHERFTSVSEFTETLATVALGEQVPAGPPTLDSRPIAGAPAATTGGYSPPPLAPTDQNRGGQNFPIWVPIAAIAGVVLILAIAAGVLMTQGDGDPTATAGVGAEASASAEITATNDSSGTATESETTAPDTTESAADPTETIAEAVTPQEPTEISQESTQSSEPVVPTDTPVEPVLVPKILFASNRNETHESPVYEMNPDGSDQQPLVPFDGHAWAPRISPDGSQIFFNASSEGDHTLHDAADGFKGEGNHDIYLADSDGSNVRNLTAGFPGWDSGWSWSPDGQWIAFTSNRDGDWEIYRMAPDGSNIQRLTFHPSQDGFPAWTPNNESIVFTSDRTGDAEIYIMNADGSNVQLLASRPTTFETQPYVSPDGTMVAFSSQTAVNSVGEIVVMGIDGSNIQQLTSTGGLNYAPTFSPDSSKILFVSDREVDDDIYIMNVDGSEQQPLTVDPGNDTTPYWGSLLVTP